MNAKEQITKSRAGLVLDLPFFGSLALRLAVKEDLNCESAWTDGVTLGYNPDFIQGLTLPETKGLLAHEVMHIAMMHNTRRGDRNQSRWNEAADYAINLILEDSGLTLPKARLLDREYADMAAEQIYGKIGKQEQEQESNNNKSRDDSGKGDDPGKTGEVRDYPGKDGKQATAADKAQAEQETKIAVTQAITQAKSMGRLPGGLSRLIDEIIEPIIDWREILRRFVSATAKNDYTWARPNRRHIAEGLYLPSLYSEDIGPIVVAVDTSGSVDQEMINQFSAEITAILEDFHADCTVIYCDSEIAGVEIFRNEDLPVILHPAGGGGTDFRPVFDYVDEHDIRPACLIYLTDMAGSFPVNEPDYPVLWGTIEAWSGAAAPWGETVRIK
jgi:predicted metal-dependent peptidase